MTLSIRILSFICILFLCGGCQHAIEREAHRAQALLNEADLLMNARLFNEAEQNAREALEKLEVSLARQPENIDFRLLRVRGWMTVFFSRNILTIEQAPIRARSLVRFPEFSELVDYDTMVKPAENELKALINGPELMSHDQQAFAHSTLAAIYRLNLNTLDHSLREYAKAVEVYQRQLNKLRNDDSNIGSHDFAIMRLENQLRSIKQAESEVFLLKESWTEALAVLQSMMGGTDLKFFSTQFDLWEGKIASLEAKLSLDERLQESSREQRLLLSIQEKKSERNLSKSERLGGKNPYQVELLHSRIQLDQIKNNLVYRIICHFQLKEAATLELARAALRGHYPELDRELIQQLEENR